MLSRLMSTSRTTVKTPSRKTTGSTLAANGSNASRDWAKNPIATSELDSAITYSVLRTPASEIVEL